MRLEKKYDEEVAKRKGMSTRTIIAAIWMAISLAGAYFLALFIFESGLLSPNLFRDMIADFGNMALRQSWGRGDIPVWLGWAIMVGLIYLIMQFIFFMGFAFFSPEGKRRGGKPSMYSRNKDPFDDKY